mmetsp:Transcript_3402/g.11387  ORF Transcript_3402/g.11387 Transcript_3402/m.11387 type:complete len:288 (+) Transcript_3402:102-965(+)
MRGRLIAATLLFRPAAHLLALRAAVRVEASVGSSAADEARKIVSLRVSARALADERQLFAEEQEPGGAAAVRAERAERGARAKRPRASKVPVYKPFGRIPADFDAATVERLIARRVQARLKRHYNEADRLQQRVLRLGVRLDDRRRTWSVQKGWARRRDAVAAADAASVRRQHELESEVEQRIRQLFSFWDADGSGRLDRSEFRLVLQVLDLPGSEEEHDATFDTWDSDASGDLDFAEVQAALRAYAASGGAGGDDDVPLELLSHEDFITRVTAMRVGFAPRATPPR